LKEGEKLVGLERVDEPEEVLAEIDAEAQPEEIGASDVD
jgi:hypothetical protein